MGGRGYRHLLHFPTAEGYVKPVYSEVISEKDPQFQYVYNHTDHLGNIRLSYTKVNGITKTLEENHYYPFGLKHQNYNQTKKTLSKRESNQVIFAPQVVESDYNFKYNSKELQTELDLNWYDYGARNYDASLGRWMNIDPLSEMSRRFSPYTYTLNNPVYFVDPDGMMATPPDDYVFDENNNFVRIDENYKPDQIVIENSKTCEEIGRYDFNDQVNDTKSIKDGSITKINIISQEDISNAMIENGTEKLVEDETGNYERFKYLYNESKNAGKLDHFYSSSLVYDDTFHLVTQGSGESTTNIGYNPKDFGNFLWGRAGATLGFGITILKAGAHVNNAVNGASDNPGVETGVFDAREDQQAIQNGFAYPSNFKMPDTNYSFGAMY